MFTVLDDLLQTLFPSYCRGCRKAIPTKTTLCLHCLSELPTTNFHLSNSNPLMKLLQQLTPISYATSLFFFEQQGLVQQLIHQLKYMNGEQLTKQLQVGYVPQNLIRHKATKTLVRLNTQQRAGQIKDAVSLIDTSVFTGKHLLLVDDVVTTGTTLSEAANYLLQIEDAQVSVATIAFAKSPLP